MANVDYIPPPTINRFLQSDAMIRGLYGPLGSGKSAGCVIALLKLASEQKPDDDGIKRSRFAIIRNTNRVLMDTTLKTVFDWLPPHQAGNWVSSRGAYHIQFDNIESEWLMRPLDRPEDTRNLLSLELTGAWLNEAREITSEVLMPLLGRVGRYPRGTTDYGIIVDSNPPPMGGFWYQLFENHTPEQQEMFEAYYRQTGRAVTAIFKQPSGRADNAENIDNLPPNYYETLIAANADKGQNWIRNHVDAEYGQDPQNEPVFPEYSHRQHYSEKTLVPNKALPLCVGMDFGRTPSAVVAQFSPEGQWLVLAEFSIENAGLERFLAQWLPWMAQKFPDHRDIRKWQLWCDPSGRYGKETDEKTCFKILSANGLVPRPGVQTVETRLASVRRTLLRLLDNGEAGLLVSHTCPQLAAGFATEYAYKRLQEGDLAPQPKKNGASHLQDALQYLLSAYEGNAVTGGPGREPRQLAGGLGKPVVVGDKWSPW